MNFETTITEIEIDGKFFEDLEAVVEYTYTKAERGSRDSYGAQLEPDYPAEIELDEVIVIIDGEELDITDKLPKDVKETLIEEAFEDYEAEAEDFAASML